MNYSNYTKNCHIKKLNAALYIIPFIPARQRHINMARKIIYWVYVEKSVHNWHYH
jgi:hypothetical protein